MIASAFASQPCTSLDCCAIASPAPAGHLRLRHRGRWEGLRFANICWRDLTLAFILPTPCVSPLSHPPSARHATGDRPFWIINPYSYSGRTPMVVTCPQRGQWDPTFPGVGSTLQCLQMFILHWVQYVEVHVEISFLPQLAQLTPFIFFLLYLPF